MHDISVSVETISNYQNIEIKEIYFHKYIYIYIYIYYIETHINCYQYVKC